MQRAPYFEDSHLNDAGISLCVDALHLDRQSRLPAIVQSHLESCAACRSEVLDLYSATAGADYSTLGTHPVLDRPSRGRVAFLTRWAPVAAAAAVIGFVLIWSLRPSATIHDAPVVADNTIQTTQDQNNVQQPPASPEQITPPGKERRPAAEKPAEALYAANFEPNEAMESLSGLAVRSGGFEVIAPTSGMEFAPGTPVIFRWKGVPPGNLTFTIWNNREERIFVAETTASTLTFSDPLAPGLYYWQLESEADLLHTGKFAVRAR